MIKKLKKSLKKLTESNYPTNCIEDDLKENQILVTRALIQLLEAKPDVIKSVSKVYRK